MHLLTYPASQPFWTDLQVLTKDTCSLGGTVTLGLSGRGRQPWYRVSSPLLAGQRCVPGYHAVRDRLSLPVLKLCESENRKQCIHRPKRMTMTQPGFVPCRQAQQGLICVVAQLFAEAVVTACSYPVKWKWSRLLASS